MDCLEFQYSNCLRQRLILSTLTRRKIVIKNIRDNRNLNDFGLKKYEISLLELLEKVTNSSTITIDESGTKIVYKPGILYGGEIEHFCDYERSIGYYLEFLIPLAPFCKFPIEAKLHGITNDRIDPSVDTLKYSLESIKPFLVVASEDELQIKIISRGLRPDGGGLIVFKCPIRKSLKSVHLIDPGKVKRIRGVAFTARVSPQMANRMVDTAKGLLLKFIPDIYIYTDCLRGKNSGKSPGFGISLTAETTEKTFYVGESVSNPPDKTKQEYSLPEDVARQAVNNLLNDIYRGGTINSNSQGLIATLMTFTNRDLSKVIFGPLTPYTIQLFNHIHQFTGLKFKLDVDEKEEKQSGGKKLQKGSKKIIAACVGIGYSNLSKIVK